MIQTNNERYWLYAAVGPEPDELHHSTLEPTRTSALAEIFFAELRQKHDVDDALFLVDNATLLQEACRRHGLDCRYERHGNRNSVERVFRDIKRRTDCFSNCFSHIQPETADDWLRAFSFAWNQLI